MVTLRINSYWEKCSRYWPSYHCRCCYLDETCLANNQKLSNQTCENFENIIIHFIFTGMVSLKYKILAILYALHDLQFRRWSYFQIRYSFYSFNKIVLCFINVKIKLNSFPLKNLVTPIIYVFWDAFSVCRLVRVKLHNNSLSPDHGWYDDTCIRYVKDVERVKESVIGISLLVL